MDSNTLILGFLLIGAGFLLLAADLFLMSGILAVLSLGAIIFGVILTFLGGGLSVGIVTAAAVFIALPVTVRLLLYLWPRTPMGRHFFLTEQSEDATVAALPINQELEQLKGRIGRALSALRPAGMVDFDGRRVDTITEGMMVEAGQMVRCIDVRAGKVVVRPIEKPDLGGLETAIFN
ncbi:MAG TPA: NfeD family protein [Gemmataceae bacterium]|nr:NfeD family protein [Gemmataceae bacterium]